MASLLTDAQKAALATAFQDVVDTFSRALVVYHEPEKVIISSDVNYNRLNTVNQNAHNPQNVPIYRTIMARIWYAPKMTNPFAVYSYTNNPQDKIKMADGMVRIKVKSDDFSFIGRAKRIELDGNLFDIDTVERPHGLFGVDYYTYWLKRVQ